MSVCRNLGFLQVERAAITTLVQVAPFNLCPPYQTGPFIMGKSLAKAMTGSEGPGIRHNRPIFVLACK
jgi:hypothetical protein